MKRLIILFSFTVGYLYVPAQNIGIGTNSPAISAALQINSTTQGLLIPSMTSSQRVSISSPAEGLLVYDLSLNRLYQYQSGTWQYMINNDYWSHAPTRKWLYNGADSIGIGTSVPGERLQVTGNTLATGDLLVSGDIVTSTFQFQNGSAVDKAFLQSSGNNLRMGVNSGNTTGNLVIRVNAQDKIFVDEVGRLGIGVSNPAATVDVNGSINIAGNLTNTSATGFSPLQPLCYGQVETTYDSVFQYTGTGNFTGSFTSYAGEYKITCAGVTANSVVLATMGAPELRVRAEPHNGYLILSMYNLIQGSPLRGSVQFIVYNP